MSTWPQDRILDFLLEVEDAAERAALLPDAFTPPGESPDAADQQQSPAVADESEEVQLSTTPLRLLNAIDARISMLQVSIERC